MRDRPNEVQVNKGILSDLLIRNSFLMIATSISSSALGFIFWFVTARLNTDEEVGIAIALISTMSLLVTISRFGLEHSLVRYFPEADKSRVLSSILVVTTFSVLLIGIVLIVVPGLAPSGLELAGVKAVVFITFLILGSLISLVSTSFVAMRKPEYNLVQNLLLYSRIPLLLPLTILGSWGIFGSVGVSMIIGLTFSVVALSRLGLAPARIDTKFLRDSMKFSVGNYVVELLTVSPIYLIPIIMLALYGAAESAQFYMSYVIYSALLIIPTAFSASLFVEGSHGEDLAKRTRKCLLATYAFMIPAVAVVLFLGRYFLLVFGAAYAEGFGLLQLLSVSSLFVGANSIFFSTMRIRRNMPVLVALSTLVFVLLIGLIYAWTPIAGIEGIGYAWLVSYGSSCSVIAIIWMRNRHRASIVRDLEDKSLLTVSKR